FTQSPTVDDLNGHGTHIAGIIGAIANNGIGIDGLAYNCSLLNVKVANDKGLCDAATVAEGIVWAVDNGAKVINLSLTFTKPDQALEDAVDYAWSKGAILVGAAGNDGGSTPIYPAYYANCLAVTATNSDDLLVQLAKYGDWVDVAAPGANIYSTLPNNSYGYKSGTSMATACAAGMAGLLFDVVPDANGNGRLNDEVRYTIENSCDEIGTPGAGKGRINALRAVRR
ncbi:MAG: S8 family serine peptidase, partial [Dehalococcoidia bacterium]|nr:S8 family serine peptidase [Dehalococcoidia bacterium]